MEARDLFWTPRDDTRYTYAVAVVRALERTLLSRKTLEAMARASTPDEALEELGETNYSKFMTPSPRPENFESLLRRVLEDSYAIFRRLVLDQDLEQAVLLPHDLHNLKALIKAELAGSEAVGLVPYGLLSPDSLASALESGSFYGLPPEIEATAIRARKSYEVAADPRLLEIIVDRAAFDCKIAPLNCLDSPVMRSYAETLTDITNIRLTVRLIQSGSETMLLDEAYAQGGTISQDLLTGTLGKSPSAITDALSSTRFVKALQEGISYLQEEGSYAVLDRELENILMNTLKAVRFVIFGPAPLLAFTFAREHETNLIRLVMVAKINNIPVERIVARLPVLYV